jgi:hypothetical protein
MMESTEHERADPKLESHFGNPSAFILLPSSFFLAPSGAAV